MFYAHSPSPLFLGRYWSRISAKIRRLFTFTLVTRTDTLKSILLGQSVIIMGLLKTFQEPPFMQRG